MYSDRSSHSNDRPLKRTLPLSFSANWRKFLTLLSKNVIVTKLLHLVSNDRERVLIFDDSLYSRARSKAVELLSLVHDHTTGQFIRGFRMLTLGWSDGNTFIPLAFSLLSSAKKKNRFQEINSDIDKRTVGYKRRKEALKKSTEAMFDLLDEVNPLQLCTKTLLFDSWFAFPKVIKLVVSEYPLHVICMLKNMHRVYYTYQGEEYTLNQLYKKVRKKRGRAKILASIVVSLGPDDKGKDIQARIVFVRDRNRSKNWLALLSTNIELPDEEVVRLYGKRWDIECFFKVTKSHLRLAKEFQSRSYDAMVAHTTIVFARYIMLLSSREEEDPKTIGQLFYLCCDEMEDIRFAQALILVLDLLKSTLSNEPTLSEEKVQSIVDELVNNLPHFLKKAFLSNEEIKANAA
ncbi:transposase [Aeribacillus composti]|uniref:IS4 family transposase n=1 Tax=Aeribacillus composti TaxID=1868734 RepID=UPI002E1DE0BE|nr:transposase [Aeribacillus composti]